MSSKSRGYYGEARLAKKVKGKIVGRSKAIIFDDGTAIKINHESPPDVVTKVFAFESKYRRAFPKKISDYMTQCIANCPVGLIPVAVVKDPFRKEYYYIMREEDFTDLHIGEVKNE